jgi:hypothetical protein
LRKMAPKRTGGGARTPDQQPRGICKSLKNRILTRYVEVAVKKGLHSDGCYS